MPFVVAVMASLALLAGTDESAAQGCVGAEEAVVQAAQLAGGDGVALLLAKTTVWQGDTQVTGDDVATAIEGANTAVIRGRLTRPPAWREDEDGEPIPTFRAGRVEITD